VQVKGLIARTRSGLLDHPLAVRWRDRVHCLHADGRNRHWTAARAGTGRPLVRLLLDGVLPGPDGHELPSSWLGLICW